MYADRISHKSGNESHVAAVAGGVRQTVLQGAGAANDAGSVNDENTIDSSLYLLKNAKELSEHLKTEREAQARKNKVAEIKSKAREAKALLQQHVGRIDLPAETVAHLSNAVASCDACIGMSDHAFEHEEHHYHELAGLVAHAHRHAEHAKREHDRHQGIHHRHPCGSHCHHPQIVKAEHNHELAANHNH